MRPTTRIEDGGTSLVPPQTRALPVIYITEVLGPQIQEAPCLEGRARIIIPLHIAQPALDPLPALTVVAPDVPGATVPLQPAPSPTEDARVRTEIPVPAVARVHRRAMVGPPDVRGPREGRAHVAAPTSRCGRPLRRGTREAEIAREATTGDALMPPVQGGDRDRPSSPSGGAQPLHRADADIPPPTRLPLPIGAVPAASPALRAVLLGALSRLRVRDGGLASTLPPLTTMSEIGICPTPACPMPFLIMETAATPSPLDGRLSSHPRMTTPSLPETSGRAIPYYLTIDVQISRKYE